MHMCTHTVTNVFPIPALLPTGFSLTQTINTTFPKGDYLAIVDGSLNSTVVHSHNQ